MRGNIAVAVALLGVFAFGRAAVAQDPRVPPAGVKVGVRESPEFLKLREKQKAEIAAFEHGFEISTDGGTTWHNYQAEAVVHPCPTSTTAFCGAGAPVNVKFKVRFPAITSALDLGGGLHYAVDRLPDMPALDVACQNFIQVAAPGPDEYIAFFPKTALGSTVSFPIETTHCVWQASAKVYPDLLVTAQPVTITSNLVTVVIHARR